MSQKAQNTASVKRTVSKATESLITAKCQLADLYGSLLETMELVYGEEDSDHQSGEIYERLKYINEYVDTAIMDSIYNKIHTSHSTEF